jgi:NAD+ diphosphatase
VGKPNYFASGTINRSGNLRRDPDWLADRLADPRTRILPLHGSDVALVGGDLVWLEVGDLSSGQALSHDREGVVFLGVDGGGGAVFGIDLSAPELAELDVLLPGDSSRMDLRGAAMLLPPDAGNHVAYLSAMLSWHRRHRWCGVCGSPTLSSWGGHLRTCSGCGAEHFPRTDPVIIVIVTAGEHCLLGRQPIWPARMWSALAGFVEPGESLEDAVVREVGEEVSVAVEEVVYQSSQPWPFPLSLMLGFHASAGPEPVNITVDRSELDDARWFARDELAEAVADGAVMLPPPFSIARQLVDSWLTA